MATINKPDYIKMLRKSQLAYINLFMYKIIQLKV